MHRDTAFQMAASKIRFGAGVISEEGTHEVTFVQPCSRTMLEVIIGGHFSWIHTIIRI